MSYYDWVQKLQILKTSPMDDDIINNLENQKLDSNPYVINKLLIHMFKAINTRLNNGILNCIKELQNNIDINTLSIHFVNIKKEKQYVSKLVNLSILDIENKNTLKDFIEQKYNYIYDYLKKIINLIDTNGEYVSTLEKIMSSDMEEKI